MCADVPLRSYSLTPGGRPHHMSINTVQCWDVYAGVFSATPEYVVSTVDWSVVRARRDIWEYWSVHWLLLHLSHRQRHPTVRREVWGCVDVRLSTQLRHKDHHAIVTRCPLYFSRRPRWLWNSGLRFSCSSHCLCCRRLHHVIQFGQRR